MKKLTILIIGLFLISLVYAIDNYVAYDFEKSTYKTVEEYKCSWELKKEFTSLKPEEMQILIETKPTPTIDYFYNRVCKLWTYEVEVMPSKDDIIAGLKAEIYKLDSELNMIKESIK